MLYKLLPNVILAVSFAKMPLTLLAACMKISPYFSTSSSRKRHNLLSPALSCLEWMYAESAIGFKPKPKPNQHVCLFQEGPALSYVCAVLHHSTCLVLCHGGASPPNLPCPMPGQCFTDSRQYCSSSIASVCAFEGVYFAATHCLIATEGAFVVKRQS